MCGTGGSAGPSHLISLQCSLGQGLGENKGTMRQIASGTGRLRALCGPAKSAKRVARQNVLSGDVQGTSSIAFAIIAVGSLSRPDGARTAALRPARPVVNRTVSLVLRLPLRSRPEEE